MFSVLDALILCIVRENEINISNVLEFLQDAISLVDVYSPIIRRVEVSIYNQNTRPVYTQIRR